MSDLTEQQRYDLRVAVSRDFSSVLPPKNLNDLTGVLGHLDRLVAGMVADAHEKGSAEMARRSPMVSELVDRAYRQGYEDGYRQSVTDNA